MGRHPLATHPADARAAAVVGAGSENVPRLPGDRPLHIRDGRAKVRPAAGPSDVSGDRDQRFVLGAAFFPDFSSSCSFALAFLPASCPEYLAASPKNSLASSRAPSSRNDSPSL